jgi:hypothetical protein
VSPLHNNYRFNVVYQLIIHHSTVTASSPAGDATHGGTDIILASTPCYCRGTRILTDRGEVPVEALRICRGMISRNVIGRTWSVPCPDRRRNP